MCIKSIKFYLNQLYYILILFYYLKNLKNYINNDNYEEANNIIIKIKCCINNIGVFSIKLVQWVIEKIKLTNSNKEIDKLLKQFNNYYENCPVHSFDFTKKIYKKSFNESIYKEYVVDIEPIASGSIGQVYKGYLKNDSSKKVAIKVVHPDIDKQLFIPKILLKFYNKFSKICNCGFNIPFELDKFFDYLNMQINLEFECENIERHKLYFKDNKFIVIPHVYKFSKDVIIMSYEEGVFYENLNISDYSKSKILTILRLYVRSSLVCNNYIHGDLHNGNWKVRPHPTLDNNYQIILYDLGLCVNLNNHSFMRRF
jgi:predicted unusual protein kinase regulating ubiquinone biosynthesis (AarF/ABC1/UbiB family)